jgi:hypothetical protein
MRILNADSFNPAGFTHVPGLGFKKALMMPPDLDPEIVATATGPGRITSSGVYTVPKRPANAHGSGFKGFAGRTYARALSPEQQRWVDLIAAAKPQSRAKV